MTCKDCIHYEECSDVWGEYAKDAEKTCKHFKDKSCFIELPCKVGDRVYMLNRDKTKVQEMIFEKPYTRCHCKKDDGFTCCMPDCKDKQNGICVYWFCDDFSEIGETVFLTREEAEKALKERENNDKQ